MSDTALSGTHPGPSYRLFPGTSLSAWTVSAASGQGGLLQRHSSSSIWRPVLQQEQSGRGDKNRLLNQGGKCPWHFYMERQPG